MQKHPNNKNHPEPDHLLAAKAKPTLPNGNKHEPAPAMNKPNTGTQPSLADQSKPADSPANKDQVRGKREQTDVELRAVLRMMIAALKQGQNRRFMVGLVGYWIEGIPYGASGLSLDAVATPEVQITDEGFSCIAFFPPELIEAGIVRKNGIITMRFGQHPAAVVRVRVDIRARDIWFVTEFIRGEHHYLFHASDILAAGIAFREEAKAWRAPRN